MLTLNWNIFWTFFNLIVLFLLLRHFLFRPVLGIIEKRQNVINDSLKQAEAQRIEADALKAQYEDTMKEAKAQSEEIVAQARQRAQKEYNEILKSASADAQKAMDQAQKNIVLEQTRAVRGAKKELAELALAAAAKVAQKEMDSSANDALLEAFISEAGASR